MEEAEREREREMDLRHFYVICDPVAERNKLSRINDETFDRWLRVHLPVFLSIVASFDVDVAHPICTVRVCIGNVEQNT